MSMGDEKMICNNCKTEYDSHAMTCPNCGAPNNTAKKNKMPVWMHVVAVMSVVVIFSYIFCFSKGVLFKNVDLFKNEEKESHTYEYNNGTVEVKGETTTEEQLRLPENIVSEKETLKDDKKKDDKKGDKKKETTTKKHSNGTKPVTTKPSTTKPATTAPSTTQPTTAPTTTPPSTTAPTTTPPPTTTEKSGIKDQLTDWFK